MNNNMQPEAVWCFRHWTRKPWAAFASIRRFKYGHLSVAMSIILLANTIAGAQTVGTDSLSAYRTMHLDAVSVTARQHGAAASHQPVSQTRFLVDQKGHAPLGNAESVLRLLPSVDIRERGGKSTQADIAIRGGSFDQTMVMLNGVDFSDARTGHQSHSLPVDLDIVSDMAVLDGAARPGALAGAVDFRTAPAFPRYLRARLEGGKWGYAYGNLSGAHSGRGFGPNDRATVLGAVSYKRSDGYRYNTDFWNVNSYARVLYESPRAGWFDIQGGFQRREWGSNGFYSITYPDQFESTLTGLASIRWTRSWQRLTVEALGSFRQNNDRYEMQRGNPAGIPFNFHTTYNTAASLTADYLWPRAGVSSLGIHYSRNTMFSTAMGESIENPSRPIPTLDDRFYTKRAFRDVSSAWIGHRKDWRSTWAASQASITNTRYGTAGAFVVETGWQPGRVMTLKASAQRSMRLPTFTDLYYAVAVYHPNPNLQPETAMTYRLTAQAVSPSKRWHGEGSVWYRRTRNVIDWEQRTGDRPGDVAGHWYSTQLNRLGTVGIELTGRYSSPEGVLRSLMLSYGFLHSDLAAATDYISKYALDYMRHKVSGVVGVALPGNFALTLTGSFYDRFGGYIDIDGNRQGYKPYFLLDGRLSWSPRAASDRSPGVQLYLDGTNLLAARYFDFGGLPMPGTWLSAGIVLTLK